MRNAKASRTRKHAHKPRPGGGPAGSTEYRLTATWPTRPTHPVTYRGPDLARLKATARGLASKGAYVVLAKYTPTGTYRTVQEIDGPAILAAAEAERVAAEHAEAARRAAEHAARAQAAAAVAQARRDRAQAAALMVQPPVPRTPQQRTARHTAGQR